MSKWHRIRVGGAVVASAVLHGAVVWALVVNSARPPSIGVPSPSFVEVSLVAPQGPVSPIAAAASSIVDPPADRTSPATQTVPVAPPDTSEAKASAAAPSPQTPALHLAASSDDAANTISTTPALNGDAVDLYGQTLMDHIRRYRSYPASARQAHIEGQVVLKFEIDRQGHVLDAYVEQSSGTPALDAEALATINRAQPLPAIPDNLPDHLSLSLPISFNLRS